MIKGVFFDVGGTLFSYSNLEPLTREFIAKFAERFAVDASSDELFGKYYAATKHCDGVYAVQPFYLFADYFNTMFEHFMSGLGLEGSPADFDWFEENQINTLIGGLELKPDCHEALDGLRSRELYLSAVSNADDDMLRSLIERGDLEHRLDHWTSSEAARSYKPDQRFFQIALELAGLQPENVLFVGDSIEQDIYGAHQAGMRTALISEGDGPAPMHVGRETVEPDHRITNLTALLDIVD